MTIIIGPETWVLCITITSLNSFLMNVLLQYYSCLKNSWEENEWYRPKCVRYGGSLFSIVGMSLNAIVVVQVFNAKIVNLKSFFLSYEKCLPFEMEKFFPSANGKNFCHFKVKSVTLFSIWLRYWTYKMVLGSNW